MIIAVIDTETTGIPERHSWARVIEVGAVVCDWTEQGCREVAAFESLARPAMGEHAIPEAAEALGVNRLTVEQIDAAPWDFQVGQALEAWLVAHEVVAVTAFNAGFDFDPCLLGSGRWLGRWLRHVYRLPCLQEAAHTALQHPPYTRGGRLVDCVRRFGLPLLSAHKALDDARMAASLVPVVLSISDHRDEVAPFAPFAPYVRPT